MSDTAAAQLNNNEEPGLNGKTPSVFLQGKLRRDPNVALKLPCVGCSFLWSCQTLLCNIYCLTELNGWNFLIARRGEAKGRSVRGRRTFGANESEGERESGWSCSATQND